MTALHAHQFSHEGFIDVADSDCCPKNWSEVRELPACAGPQSCRINLLVTVAAAVPHFRHLTRVTDVSL